MKTMRALLISAGALFAVAGLNGQVDFAGVLKLVDYDQTGAATTTQTGVGLEAFISGNGLTALNPSGTNEFGYPTGQTHSLIFTAEDSEWETDDGSLTTSFADLAALTSAFPNGTISGDYSITVGGSLANLTLNTPEFPNIALGGLVLTSDGVTSVGSWTGTTLWLTASEASQELTFKSNSFVTNFGTNHVILLNIFGPDTNIENMSFVNSSVSQNLAADAFTAGNTYGAELEFINLTTFDTTSLDAIHADAVAIAGFSVITEFSIQVIPEPSTYAAIFGVLALAGVAIHRRRRAA